MQMIVLKLVLVESVEKVSKMSEIIDEVESKIQKLVINNDEEINMTLKISVKAE